MDKLLLLHTHIGNTGINAEDNESAAISARGLIVKIFASNQATGELIEH